MMIYKMFIIGVLSLSIAPAAYANFDNAETQKAMFDLGYESVYDALKESNSYFKREIKLPIQIPPLPFTHVLGRFNEKNGSFEIEYLNQNFSPYRITVIQKKAEIRWNENNATQTFTLKDGSKGSYFARKPHMKSRNYFNFEKNGWKYFISVHPDVSDVVTPELLVEIANSIN